MLFAVFPISKEYEYKFVPFVLITFPHLLAHIDPRVAPIDRDVDTRQQGAEDRPIAVDTDYDQEPEIGKIYEGKVVKLMDFGAFVNFMGSKDGLVHISQLKNERVEKVSDVIKEGDIVKVKVLDVDGRGKVKLSMKEVEAEQ